jgi:MoaA/NifB/PqqE/SkfB family radical SAM enzyme
MLLYSGNHYRENKMKLENKVSAHEGLGALPNSLKELWLEIGGSCHLRCSYCFAESGGIDKSLDNVSIDQVKKYIKEFQELDGERIGIVGAGEPFHPRNIEDTFQILEAVKPSKIKTTIFTTADLLNNNSINRLNRYPNLVLLVKYNSQIPKIQDSLVNVKGYTERREKAMQELIKRGFNDGRLGVVTSILEKNSEEIPKMFRYARDNNLIFDADTPIPRGRGKTCNREEIARLAKPIIEQLSKIDREEYGNTWEPHASYIASPPCTRFNQHLYVKKDGIVIPCVGSQDVVLGNVKTESLKDIWEKPITKIIRGHNYEGKCTSCKNYQEQKCFSCLGRSTEDLSTEQLLKEGYVKTIGCFQYRKEK